MTRGAEKNPPVLYESHMHTPLCKHAVGEPEDYAAVAKRRGLKGIIVTCHNPMRGDWASDIRMHLDEFEDYVAMVERAREAKSRQVDIRLGIESDYVPGMEAWLEEFHAMTDLHHVLGSVHPHLPEYRAVYLNGDVLAFQRIYFEHLAMAAETGLFDTLAHPDLVKNVEPSQWHPERLMGHICRCLDRIATTGVAMELNTSGLNKAFSEMNPGCSILKAMHERRIPVVLGSDAHEPGRVADRFEDALDVLNEVGYTHVAVFLHRQRIDLDIQTVRRSLRR